MPVRARFVDDCETPVSAFLKLRAGEPEGAPCFLLESAEQGQVGRYSFVGLRPRAVLRWSDGTLSEWSGEAAAAGAEPARSDPAPDPYAAVAARLADFRPAPVEGLPPFVGGAVGFFGYDLVRTVEPLGRAQPRPARAARHGADGHRRDGRLRPPAPRADDPRLRLRRRRRRHRRRLRARRGDDRRDARAPARRRARPRRRRRSPSRRSSSPTWSARSSKPRSSGSSSTSTPATPSRSSPRSASRPRPRSRPSRSTAACARSTPRPTCTSSSSATSRSPAPRRSRWSRSAAAGSRRGRSPAPTRAGAARTRTAASPSGWSTTRRSGPST